jgi:hypothetical protein
LVKSKDSALILTTGGKDSPKYLLTKCWGKLNEKELECETGIPDTLLKCYENYRNCLSNSPQKLSLPRLSEQFDSSTSLEEKMKLVQEKAEPDCFCTLKGGKPRFKLGENLPVWNHPSVGLEDLAGKDLEFVFRSALRYLDALVFADPYILPRNTSTIKAINRIIEIWRNSRSSRKFEKNPPGRVVIITSTKGLDKENPPLSNADKDVVLGELYGILEHHGKKLNIEVRSFAERSPNRYLGDAGILDDGNTWEAFPGPVWRVNHDFNDVGRVFNKWKVDSIDPPNLIKSDPLAKRTVVKLYKQSKLVSPPEQNTELRE